MKYKKGDTIIMLEDCLQGPFKGEELEVKFKVNERLYVEGSNNRVCRCQDKWKLATPLQKDWDNLAVDDVLVDRDGEKRYVLGTTGRIIFISCLNMPNKYYMTRTKEELIEYGYTILQDEEPIPETIEIEGIKYNKQVVDDLLKSIK